MTAGILAGRGIPALMFQWVMGKSCRDQQIAPVNLCEIDRFPKWVEFASAQLEGGELEPLEALLVAVSEQGEVVATFLEKQARHLGTILGPEEQIKAAQSFRAERRCGHERRGRKIKWHC
jgi:hypothetical protein